MLVLIHYALDWRRKWKEARNHRMQALWALQASAANIEANTRRTQQLERQLSERTAQRQAALAAASAAAPLPAPLSTQRHQGSSPATPVAIASDRAAATASTTLRHRRPGNVNPSALPRPLSRATRGQPGTGQPFSAAGTGASASEASDGSTDELSAAVLDRALRQEQEDNYQRAVRPPCQPPCSQPLSLRACSLAHTLPTALTAQLEEDQLKAALQASELSAIEADLERAAERDVRLERFRNMLLSEPATAGTTASDAAAASSPGPVTQQPRVTTLRLQVPGMPRLQRRFLASEPIQHVAAFLLVKVLDEGTEVESWVLSESFPSRVLLSNGDLDGLEDSETESEAGATKNRDRSLESLGLVPNAALNFHFERQDQPDEKRPRLS